MSPRRTVTVYQVVVDGKTVSEHSDLASARAEAVKVGGRVKVEAKAL